MYNANQDPVGEFNRASTKHSRDPRKASRSGRHRRTKYPWTFATQFSARLMRQGRKNGKSDPLRGVFSASPTLVIFPFFLRAAMTNPEKLDNTRNADSASEQTAQDGDGVPPLAHPPFKDSEPPFSLHFFDKSPAGGALRAVYLKTMFGGSLALSIVIFAVFSIYWGALWKTPLHTLPGWIVDFDGGSVGQGVVQAFSAINPGTGGISWSVVPASEFPGGIEQLEDAILREKTWYGLAINVGASSNFTAAISSANAAYNSSTAITFIGSEARSENIFRQHIRIVTTQLDMIAAQFALQVAKNISSSLPAANLATLLSTAPQVVTAPLGYTVANLRPFDIPVASAVTFVGLIYLLILSFFVVMVSSGARAASGMDTRLTLGSLISVRLLSSVLAYFFISLFYTLLSRAFQLPFDRRFGSAGLVIFWMLNWIGMLACGLALEAMITLLTVRFVPFFLIIWIISNVSVCIYPIPVLPHVFRYGYGFPFYNISRAVRTIVFRTKDDVGMNFGILLAWVAVSCITLPIFQWVVRRGQRRAAAAGAGGGAGERA
ncbi:DUF3533 domain-containing protein [Mycena venus]|uniref:DUF3533 domain-containing protein n=1 Tax=Mycena venus TaxID=2733690 RepID=A0A8H6Y0P3_9AGAR|nr:DUF3533 domain-containing protein [Mycena venus]